ncbi:hypothetical protein LTR86_008171 [Recurvomyces mirabilis]|nr:hypothetical protein LTR86_008171 [Recurvomyces mirabilis]
MSRLHARTRLDDEDIIAAVFGGISAVNALFELFKKWKGHRKKKAEELAQRVEQAFTRAPRILEETCSSCVRRAGDAFRVGDTLAHTTIGSAVAHFEGTLRGTLDLAIGGQVLDLVGVRRILDGFSEEIVRALGSLYTRVLRNPAVATSVAATTSLARFSTAALTPARPLPAIEFKHATDYATIAVPALAPLDGAVSRTFEHTLDAIRSESKMCEFSSSLARDLDAIDSLVPLDTFAADMPTVLMGSQQVLRDIMAEYAP